MSNDEESLETSSEFCTLSEFQQFARPHLVGISRRSLGCTSDQFKTKHGKSLDAFLDDLLEGIYLVSLEEREQND